MKPLIALLAAALLTSCVGGQHVTFDAAGNPSSATQIDAIMAKGQSSARQIKLPNGVVISSVQQGYDAEGIPRTLLDDKLTLGLAKRAAESTDLTTKTGAASTDLKTSTDAASRDLQTVTNAKK